MRVHNACMPESSIFPGTTHDLGGFSVRRLLPRAGLRHVGPFVFFDHMGPARFSAGRGIDVRPHPHIGLATVTYLFEGAIEHRDSLRSVVTIRPGDVNWMTAGSGIVHSERTPETERKSGHHLHGIQTWVALPQADEETVPRFHHHAAEDLPHWRADGTHFRLLVGDAFGRRSPVRTFSPIFLMAAELDAGARVRFGADHDERAVYAADAAIHLDGAMVPAMHMALLPPKRTVEIVAPAAARIILCGGAALAGERHVWWNFVSSSRERIERAKSDWVQGRFGAVPGDAEFIPLPAH